MNKKLGVPSAQGKQEKNPREQRLHFILLRVLLFLACIAVSVGIWLAVHYVEHLKSEEPEAQSSISYFLDGNSANL
jgi:flagellar basal body-associated protein FliL